MKLDELKGVASSMGIKGTTKMRKSDLVEAIKARQSGGGAGQAQRRLAPAALPPPPRVLLRLTAAPGAAPRQRRCAEAGAPRRSATPSRRRPDG